MQRVVRRLVGTLASASRPSSPVVHSICSSPFSIISGRSRLLLDRSFTYSYTATSIHTPSSRLHIVTSSYSTSSTSASTSTNNTRKRQRKAAEMLQGCTLKAALAKSERASMGVWQTLPGQNVSRVLARTPGVDWVLVDCEHGNIDDAAMHEAVPAIASCGVSPIVRLPDMQGWMIKSWYFTTYVFQDKNRVALSGLLIHLKA